MCRNIVRLREGTEVFDRDAMEQAAVQYVRKVSGFRTPSAANAAVFEAAVRQVAAATEELMAGLVVRSPA